LRLLSRLFPLIKSKTFDEQLLLHFKRLLDASFVSVEKGPEEVIALLESALQHFTIFDLRNNIISVMNAGLSSFQSTKVVPFLTKLIRLAFSQDDQDWVAELVKTRLEQWTDFSPDVVSKLNAWFGQDTVANLLRGMFVKQLIGKTFPSLQSAASNFIRLVESAGVTFDECFAMVDYVLASQFQQQEDAIVVAILANLSRDDNTSLLIAQAIEFSLTNSPGFLQKFSMLKMMSIAIPNTGAIRISLPCALRLAKLNLQIYEGKLDRLHAVAKPSNYTLSNCPQAIACVPPQIMKFLLHPQEQVKEFYFPQLNRDCLPVANAISALKHPDITVAQVRGTSGSNRYGLRITKSHTAYEKNQQQRAQVEKQVTQSKSFLTRIENSISGRLNLSGNSGTTENIPPTTVVGKSAIPINPGNKPIVVVDLINDD
jgi:hypothetical protein